MIPLRVLIIEDSENDALLLLRTLRKGGYEPEYLRVQTRETMGAALQENKWDLILSDHDMPDFSAPEALKILKASGLDLPFIIVSGAIGEETAVAAMKAGAHDFIKKGQWGRLIPAIERELRETENRHERRRMEEELQIRHREIQALSGRILNAYEEERTRLARELHDEIGQALTVVSMDLQYLQLNLPPVDPFFQEKLEAGIKQLGQTLENVRRLIVALRPPALDKMGLVEVVRDMAQELACRARINIHVKANGFAGRLPSYMETGLYRCIQEGLTNGVRHSGAHNVIIELEELTHAVKVVVEDDGQGFDLEDVRAKGKGVGLAGMLERVRLMGGDMEIRTGKEKGTCISITVPKGDDGP